MQNSIDGAKLPRSSSQSGLLFVSGLLLVIALGLAAFGAHEWSVRSSLSSRGVTAWGTVKEVSTYTSNNKRKHRAMVTFSDGRSGRDRTIKLNGRFNEGDKVELIYLPEDPDMVRTRTSLHSSTAVSGPFFIAFIFLVIAALSYRSYHTRRKELEWLVSHGEWVEATVVGVDEKVSRKGKNYSVSVGGARSGRRRRRSSYVVVARWSSSRTGVEHTFRSEPLTSHPGDQIYGTTCRVLVDTNNPSVYHFAYTC